MNTPTTLTKTSHARLSSGDLLFKAGSSTLSINTDCKVLYVEDNVFNQELARMLFNKIGSKVDIANNGYEALEMIMMERYDIVFMDINMPGLNGYETTTIIRQKLALQIPILALTHCDSDEDIKRCKAVGMNDHLKKPLNEKELLHSIHCWRKDRLQSVNR